MRKLLGAVPSFRLGVVVAGLLFIAGFACSSVENGDSSGAQFGGQFPVTVTDTRVEAGTALYATNCASCHGIPGVSRPTIPTAPPHDESGHTWHHADRLLFEWTLDRPPLAEIMPAFRGVLSEDEILSILAYIKSTWPEDIQQFQMEGSLQYEQQVRDFP